MLLIVGLWLCIMGKVEWHSWRLRMDMIQRHNRISFVYRNIAILWSVCMLKILTQFTWYAPERLMSAKIPIVLQCKCDARTMYKCWKIHDTVSIIQLHHFVEKSIIWKNLERLNPTTKRTFMDTWLYDYTFAPGEK